MSNTRHPRTLRLRYRGPADRRVRRAGPAAVTLALQQGPPQGRTDWTDDVASAHRGVLPVALGLLLALVAGGLVLVLLICGG